MLIGIVKVIFLHQLRGITSRINEIYQILGLFGLLAISFPLAQGGMAGAVAMANSSIAALWLGFVVVGIVSSHLYFDSDWHDGTLEIMANKPGRVGAFALAVFLVNLVIFGLPVILLATLLGAMLKADFDYAAHMVAFAMAYVSVSAMAQLMAAVTVGLRQRSGIVGLLLLPMLTPVIILGGIISFPPDENSVTQAINGLAGLALLYAPLSLWLSAMALESAVKR